MAKLDRRSVLVGSLAGVSVGGGTGFFSGSLSARGAQAPTVTTPEVEGSRVTYAQQGEDRVVVNMLNVLGVERPSYLDIGAHDPIVNSNTYLLYKAGGRGVLVEPNPFYAKFLAQRRPGDVVLEVGIGLDAKAEADYYVTPGDGQRNTFSKEQIDELVRERPGYEVKVIKRALVPIEDVLSKHFPSGGPDFLSVDVEGLDYDILRTLDFRRHRPKVVCVESCRLDGTVHEGILRLMADNDYALRGGSYVNSIFLDQRALRARQGVSDGGLEGRDR